MKKTMALMLIVLMASLSYGQTQTQPVEQEKILVEFFYKNVDVLQIIQGIENTRLSSSLTFKEYDYANNVEAKKRVEKILEKFPNIDLVCIVGDKWLAGSDDIKVYFEAFMYHVSNPDKVKHPYEMLKQTEDNTNVDNLESKLNWILGLVVLFALGYIRKLPPWVQRLLVTGISVFQTIKEKSKEKTKDES